MAIPPTAYVPVGSEFEQGQPLGNRVRFNGEGGVRKEWWWQAGPVDSCCCCISLATGALILAVIEAFNGISTLYTLSLIGTPSHQALMAAINSTYADTCEGVTEPPPECGILLAQVVTFAAQDKLYALILIQGCFCTVAGVVGTWAVVTNNVQGAKLYLWACLPWYLVGLVTSGEHLYLYHLHHADSSFWAGAIVGAVMNFILVIYFFKVIWSYYVTLKRKSRAAATALTGTNEAGSIELDGSRDTVV